MTKPLIALVLDYDEKNTSEGGYSDFPWYALRAHYSKAIVDNGGIPVHISYEHNLIEDYTRLFDGFIMPGGNYDINPTYYQESVDPKAEIVEYDNRHKFEMKLLEQILSKKVPFLGICAGQQLLNVLLGGTLYQDIDSYIDTDIDHRHMTDIGKDWHNIKVSKDSLLYKIVGKEVYKVNSHHHQAVLKVGRDLVVSAVADDGVIEAIEHKHQPFCMGVEWHPEYQKNAQDKKLIHTFVEVAKKHSLSRLIR
jgi:putative glutamine amidotransferase